MARAAYQPIPRYPASLEAHIAEADRLARAIGILAQKAAPEHPAFLWLRGRADEIRAMVQEIVREWSSDGLETSLACDAIGGYVGAIHAALHRCYGDGSGASCCGPHLEPFDRPPASAPSLSPSSSRPQFDSEVRTRSGPSGVDRAARSADAPSRNDTLTDDAPPRSRIRSTLG